MQKAILWEDNIYFHTCSIDVDGEAKRLLGLGQKNLVMGDIPSAVNAFQEAASLL